MPLVVPLWFQSPSCARLMPALRPSGIRVMLLVYGNAAFSYNCGLEIAKNELGL